MTNVEKNLMKLKNVKRNTWDYFYSLDGTTQNPETVTELLEGRYEERDRK